MYSIQNIFIFKEEKIDLFPVNATQKNFQILRIEIIIFKNSFSIFENQLFSQVSKDKETIFGIISYAEVIIVYFYSCLLYPVVN